MMHARAASNNSGFFAGLIVGGAVGAALAIAFAPTLAAELRERVTGAANDASDAVSSRYRDASTRVAGVVDEVTARGQAVRDTVADAVGRSARSVEDLAMASKSVDSRRS
jgi:gas vesicle protein